MPLAEYLASEQAREDVRALLERRRLTPNFTDIHAKNPHRFMGITKTGAWHVVTMSVEGETCQALYRPDGDRFVVTDLGEGVRTACLRGLDLANAEHFERLNALGRTLDADFRQTAPLGWIELRDITAADLPDALCRVMLASLKVSEVQP